MQMSIDGGQFAARLREAETNGKADATTQPMNGRRSSDSALPMKLQRCPQQLLSGKAVEPGRHHADNRVGLSVKLNWFADDAAVGAVPVPPEGRAEHNKIAGVRRVFLWRKQASERRLNAQSRHPVIGDLAARHALGLRSAAAEVELPRHMRTHAGQQSALLFPAKEILSGKQIVGPVCLPL